MREALEDFWGNPSSPHEAGSRAKLRIAQAREQIASVIDCHADEVYFTSGGTEADNWAILGTLDYQRGKKDHLITAATEHHAVIETAEWCEERGFKVTVLGVDSDGRLDPEKVRAAIRKETALVSVMQVNNELGVIQDIAEIGKICGEAGVTFHADCVQGFGKMPLKFAELNADMISISSHKIYGPKGVGALIIKRGCGITQRSIGGGQERGLRPGTENVPGIIGFGKAAELCSANLPDEMHRICAMRDHLESRIVAEISDVKINGSQTYRAAAMLNVSFMGCEGEDLLIALDMREFCLSTGSACSAGATGASHVLLGLGMPMAAARASLRLSFGRFNQDSDVDTLMEVLPGIVKKQRELSTIAQ
jgi:cysteine desulfurase